MGAANWWLLSAKMTKPGRPLTRWRKQKKKAQTVLAVDDKIADSFLLPTITPFCSRIEISMVEGLTSVPTIEKICRYNVELKTISSWKRLTGVFELRTSLHGSRAVVAKLVRSTKNGAFHRRRWPEAVNKFMASGKRFLRIYWWRYCLSNRRKSPSGYQALSTNKNKQKQHLSSSLEKEATLFNNHPYKFISSSYHSILFISHVHPFKVNNKMLCLNDAVNTLKDQQVFHPSG